MKTEYVEGDRLFFYMPFLDEDEVTGILDGRFAAIGALDDPEEVPLGILVAQILPDYIRIRRVQVETPEVASALLSVVFRLPNELKLPFMAFDPSEDELAYLMEAGFEETESRYVYLEGWTEELAEGPDPAAMQGKRVVCVDRVPGNELVDYLLRAEKDRCFIFPEPVPDPRRFSAGSLVCLKGGKIAGVLLMEEPEDIIQVSFLCAAGPEERDTLFIGMRELLFQEFGPGKRLRFLLDGGLQDRAFCERLPEGKKRAVRILKRG